MRFTAPILGRAWALALAAVAALEGSAAAQGAVPPAIGRARPAERVYTYGGWDTTFVAGAGLSSRVAQRGAASLDFDGGLAVPVVLLARGRALQTGLGLTAHALSASGWGVSASLHPDLRSSSDDVLNALALGVRAGLRPGYTRDRFTVAADFGWSAALFAVLAPRSAVGALFAERYPDTDPSRAGPSTAVYALTSQRLHAGGAAGWAFARAAAVHGSLGFAWTPQRTGLVNPPYGPLPFYATLGGDYRW